MEHINCEFLTKEEEARLVKHFYATGNEDARNRVVMGVYPFLVRWLSKKLWKSQTLEDMTNTAVMAAIQCLEDGKYDPDICRFSTYVVMPIQNELRKMGSLIKTPQNGSWYENEELRDGVNRARMIQTNVEDIDFDGSFRPGSATDDAEELIEWRKQLRKMLNQLSERDQSILLDTDTYTEIGKKYEMTRQRVEQIKNKAIKKFRKLVGNW